MRPGCFLGARMSEGNSDHPVDRRQQPVPDPAADSSPSPAPPEPDAPATFSRPKRRGGSPRLAGQLLPGVAASPPAADAPPPSSNARYQQLKNSGPRLDKPRRERAAARQKALFRLDRAGNTINATTAPADEIAYIATFLVHGTLPYRDPGPDVRLWRRVHRTPQGPVTIVFEAGTTIDADGQERSIGLPWGIYPRLIYSAITTQLLTERKRELVLGDTLSEWMREGLQITPTGGEKGTITRVREQVTRLLNTRIRIHKLGIEGQRPANLTIVPLKADSGLWAPDLARTLRAEDYGAYLDSIRNPTILVDEEFFSETLRRATPFDRRVQALLARQHKCMAIDLYRLITLRQFALEKAQAVAPELILYEDLGDMLGADVAHFPDFRRSVTHALEDLAPLYPGGQAEPRAKGILIRPGRPHIPARPKSVRTIELASKARTRALPPSSSDAGE